MGQIQAMAVIREQLRPPVGLNPTLIIIMIIMIIMINMIMIITMIIILILGHRPSWWPLSRLRPPVDLNPHRQQPPTHRPALSFASSSSSWRWLVMASVRSKSTHFWLIVNFRLNCNQCTIRIIIESGKHLYYKCFQLNCSKCSIGNLIEYWKHLADFMKLECRLNY